MDNLTNKRREELIIPNKNFITALLNIDESRIASFDVEINQDVVIYHIVLKRTGHECPKCGESMISWGHAKEKTVNIASLRELNGYIKYLPNRYYCKCCNITQIEDNPFAFERFKMSYQLIRSVFRYVKDLNYTLDMISKELNISTTHINNYIDSYIVVPKRPLPEWLGIDELHSPELAYKNSSYLCVLVDGKERCAYDILGSRSKAYLNNFFDKFSKEEREAVKYVTIDLWEPYKMVAKRCFPNCVVAVDPFHFCKHLYDGFDNLRINLMKQCEYNSNRYYLLKKWNWLLNTNDVNLDNEPQYNSRFKTKMNRRDILNTIFKEFPILNDAYFMKEKFKYAVANYDYETMKTAYDTYVKHFKEINVKEYGEFIAILENWKEEILNSFLKPYGDHKLSNALTENINGDLGTYLAVSHGISNMTRFRKRVLYAHNPNIFYSVNSTLTTDKMPGKQRGPYKKVKE